MNPNEYELMYHVEDTLWWYHGMEAISRAVIERNYPRGDSATGGLIKILDAGCGTGAVMNYLADYGKVTGLDFSPHALQFCRARGKQRLTQGSVNAMPLANNSFDLITSFDVLYFKGVDDQLALSEFRRVLKRGGRAFLRLPAYEWMRGAHDEAVNTAHRYTTHDIKQKLVKAGFVIEHLSYANTLLFPLAAFKRLVLERFSGAQEESDLSLKTGGMNMLFKKILSAEAKWVARKGLPIGLTVVALARKP
jgi:ubiquinone/menaquinone biosynthesis C-methylase UbiE